MYLFKKTKFCLAACLSYPLCKKEWDDWDWDDQTGKGF